MTMDLGDRMKRYEELTSTTLMRGLPVIIRIDGRCFSRFTKGFERPADPRMVRAMVQTTAQLVDEFNACTGYTQSDEITLILRRQSRNESEMFFGGKVQKLCSIAASAATIYFANATPIDWSGRHPMFDARVFQVPTEIEAVNALIWRELDATRNAITSLAHTKFSHRELQGKNCSQMQEMLWSVHGINFNDQPPAFKRGTYVQRQEFSVEIENWDSIPAERRPESNMVLRRASGTVKLPPMLKIDNKIEVVFDGADPVTDKFQASMAAANVDWT